MAGIKTIISKKKTQCCYSAAIHVNFPNHLCFHRPLRNPLRRVPLVVLSGGQEPLPLKVAPIQPTWPLLLTFNRGETAIAKRGNILASCVTDNQQTYNWLYGIKRSLFSMKKNVNRLRGKMVTACATSVLRNVIKCKYIFMFSNWIQPIMGETYMIYINIYIYYVYYIYTVEVRTLMRNHILLFRLDGVTYRCTGAIAI